MDNTLDTKKNDVWSKARLIDKTNFKNPKIQQSNDEFRLDDYGAIMQFSEYGKNSEYGWTIDHVLPKSKGGTDHNLNLQALHWRNNELKADNFFGIEVAVGTTGGNPYENVKGAPLKPYLDLKALEELRNIYPDNGYIQEAIDTILFGEVEFVKIA